MELKHGIKAFLANGLITFSINGSPVYNNEPMSLLRNPPVWVFDEIYIYIYIYICRYMYGIYDWSILWRSYRKLAGVGFKPTI